MKTPIHDFLKEYSARSAVRLHMPGHKGRSYLGIEDHDITEIDGADSLYHADGIISESEKNASELFGSGATLYSAEGSSLSIRAMLYVAKLYSGQKRGYVLAGRNAHSSFISAAALVDFDVEWLYPSDGASYLSCDITEGEVESYLSSRQELPFAVYITSPDYLGNITDIRGIARACHKYSVPLLVDNAHGAYLKFLNEPAHPIDLGADMCCDSAHKTLPVLTGGAYLHISKSAPAIFLSGAKSAMALFGSTSPSYLIMESLDLANRYICEGYGERLASAVKTLDRLKEGLCALGFTVIGDEGMKLTVKVSDFGYSGYEVSKLLARDNIVCEFCDPDFIVFMFSAESAEACAKALFDSFSNIVRKEKKADIRITVPHPLRVCSVREAVFSPKERISVNDANGRVLASSNVTCPPAVSLIVAGERFDDNVIAFCKYYGLDKCDVLI